MYPAALLYLRRLNEGGSVLEKVSAMGKKLAKDEEKVLRLCGSVGWRRCSNSIWRRTERQENMSVLVLVDLQS